MRRTIILAALLVCPALPASAGAESGKQVFNQACIACHSLEPDKNMTGPSLSGVLGRKAGSLSSFLRYSPALKEADVVWSEETLDSWIADPKAFIPGNHMVFQGIPDAEARADLLEFLKEATQPGAEVAMPDMGGMMTTTVPNLKEAPASSRVTAIAFCGDTYTLTMADGQTIQFWERNLRFKTDTSKDGPPPGAPAVVGAGMVGDRASVIFAAPEEFGQFIKQGC
jgi:cytochrome c